jgi:hypothetical protein
MLRLNGTWCASVFYILDQIGSAAYDNIRIPRSAEKFKNETLYRLSLLLVHEKLVSLVEFDVTHDSYNIKKISAHFFRFI